MALQSQTQRSLLFGFIASISCCGLVGIYCLLVGSIGILEERILGTTGVVAACSIIALAAAIPTHRRSWHPIGPLGMIATLPTLCLSIIAIWFSFGYSNLFEKSIAVSWTLAISLTLTGLISVARLKKQWNWTRRWTALTNSILTSFIVLCIVHEDYFDAFDRLMGVLAILLTCGIITIPILHRLSIIPIDKDVFTAALDISMTCPRCGKTQTLPAGRSKCADCGLRFTIEIQEEHCRKCGYPLYQLQSAVCPECGTPIARSVGST